MLNRSYNYRVDTFKDIGLVEKCWKGPTWVCGSAFCHCRSVLHTVKSREVRFQGKIMVGHLIKPK